MSDNNSEEKKEKTLTFDEIQEFMHAAFGDGSGSIAKEGSKITIKPWSKKIKTVKRIEGFKKSKIIKQWKDCMKFC